MSDDFKIDNPYEVVDNILRINEILKLYQEKAQSELNEITPTESLIDEARRIVHNRRCFKQLDLERERRREYETKTRGKFSQKLQADIDRCDEYLRQLDQCQKDFDEERQILSTVVRESTELHNTSKMLSNKLADSIIKIVATK